VLESQRRDLIGQVQSRAAFVKADIAESEVLALEADLTATETALDDLNSKLQLSNEQLEIVKNHTAELDVGLSSYQIDMEMELEFQKKLGEGAFGIVYLASFRGDTVAVKQLIAERVDEDSMVRSTLAHNPNRASLNHQLILRPLSSLCSLRSQVRFKAEIILLARLHHPNVCQILAAAWQAPHLAIVLEFAKNGDLGSYLKTKQGKVRARRARAANNGRQQASGQEERAGAQATDANEWAGGRAGERANKPRLLVRSLARSPSNNFPPLALLPSPPPR
jgi:hypothetical protein